MSTPSFLNFIKEKDQLDEAFNSAPYELTFGKKSAGDIFFTFVDEDDKEYRIQFYTPQGLGKNVRQVFIGQKRGSTYPDAIGAFKNPNRVIASMIEATKQFMATALGKTIDGYAINFSQKALQRGVSILPKIIRQSGLKQKLNVMDLSYSPVPDRAFVWCIRKGKDPVQVFDGPKMKGVTWDDPDKVGDVPDQSQRDADLQGSMDDLSQEINRNDRMDNNGWKLVTTGPKNDQPMLVLYKQIGRGGESANITAHYQEPGVYIGSVMNEKPVRGQSPDYIVRALKLPQIPIKMLNDFTSMSTKFWAAQKTTSPANVKTYWSYKLEGNPGEERFPTLTYQNNSSMHIVVMGSPSTGKIMVSRGNVRLVDTEIDGPLRKIGAGNPPADMEKQFMDDMNNPAYKSGGDMSAAGMKKPNGGSFFGETDDGFSVKWDITFPRGSSLEGTTMITNVVYKREQRKAIFNTMLVKNGKVLNNPKSWEVPIKSNNVERSLDEIGTRLADAAKQVSLLGSDSYNPNKLFLNDVTVGSYGEIYFQGKDLKQSANGQLVISTLARPAPTARGDVGGPMTQDRWNAFKTALDNIPGMTTEVAYRNIIGMYKLPNGALRVSLHRESDSVSAVVTAQDASGFMSPHWDTRLANQNYKTIDEMVASVNEMIKLATKTLSTKPSTSGGKKTGVELATYAGSVRDNAPNLRDVDWYVQTSKDGQTMDVDWSITFRRNTRVGAMREFGDQVKRANQYLQTVYQDAKSKGYNPTEPNLMTIDRAERSDEMAYQNEGSAYSEYEQVIGGEMQVRIK